jgi:hypothetical protein
VEGSNNRVDTNHLLRHGYNDLVFAKLYGAGKNAAYVIGGAFKIASVVPAAFGTRQSFEHLYSDSTTAWGTIAFSFWTSLALNAIGYQYIEIGNSLAQKEIRHMDLARQKPVKHA